jgi:YVTN family beta-propeller protein
MRIVLEFHQLKLIPFLRCAAINHADWKLDHGMSRETDRHPPWAKVSHDLPDTALTVYIHGIDRKLHKKHVDTLAGDDPEPASGFQIPMLQQTHTAGCAAVGNVDSIAERRTPCQVPHIKFQVPFYSTQRVKMERNLHMPQDLVRFPQKAGVPLVKKVLSLLAALITICVTAAFAQTTAATFGKVITLNGTPSDGVLDESRHLIYLVNQPGNRVDLFSTSTNAVVGSIPVGNGPLAAAMSPDNSLLYVTNGASSTVSVVDLGGQTVVRTVTMPAAPQGVEIGADGRALISTAGTAGGANTLLIFDSTQTLANQLTAVVTPPPPSTPAPLPTQTLARPTTTFLSKLKRTPNGQYIVGLTNPSATQTYLFVYEVSSGTILRSRTVTGQSTVIAMSPDGSRFMAGYTLYDINTLSILGQMNNANAPFAFTAAFNTVSNVGGAAFSPDGKTIYGAFNVAANTTPPAPANSSTLLLTDPNNLAINLGIRMPESIVAKVLITSDGSNAWSLSQSGLIWLPLSTLNTFPIIQPSTTQVFLSQNPCNPGLAQGSVQISNAGSGRLTYAVSTISSALTTAVSSGLAPSNITFTMEPGRLAVTRQAGTNLTTGAAILQGQPLDVTISSPEAINIPPLIRIYMNYRQSDQRGVIFPIPTIPNNSPVVTQIAAATLVGGDQGLEDIVLDPVRNRVYISNAGYNRVEVFDTVNQVFLSPIPVGQLPHQMALSSDGNTLYVASTGGELIDIVDLNVNKDIGHVNFPPIPRQAGGVTAALLYPQAMAASQNSLQFVMSNGGQWSVIGGTAVPRAADTLTRQTNNSNTLPTPVTMLATPDHSKIVTLAGTGIAYLYDASTNSYLSSATLFPAPIQGFYGPLGGGPTQSWLTLGGLYTNPSLTILGGSANASTGSSGTPSRNTVATAAFDAASFVRLSTPVRASINATPVDDARPTLERININTQSVQLLAVAPENPRFTVFGTTRFNIPSRSMVIDSNNVAYVITLSGLSVVPLTPNGAAAPQIAAARGIVNASDGSTNLAIGGVINVSGSSLATASTATTLPPPTVLGGSCVVFNDVPLPLLRAAGGQIQAQIPTNVTAGSNVVQVRSLATGLQSLPVTVTVQSPSNPGGAGSSGTTSVVSAERNNPRIEPKIR